MSDNTLPHSVICNNLTNNYLHTKNNPFPHSLFLKILFRYLSKTRALTTLFLFFISSVFLSAQSAYRIYQTQTYQQQLETEHPDIIEQQHQIEQQIYDFKRIGHIESVTIPIVFHIVHHPLEDLVSIDQVVSQLVALNRDFALLESGIHHPADSLEGFAERVPSVMDITFCLASVNPMGLETTAINYIPSTIQSWSDFNNIKSTLSSGADAWDTDRYLNIWVANLGEKNAGYAQMPGGPNNTDGIVIDYRYFGLLGTAQAPFNEGKTLTHLVGNYLGLFDLWNEQDPCKDDKVFDTPTHNAPNFGKIPSYKHVSTCSGYPVEMTMNFMDSADDSEMYMFTKGQKRRIHAAFAENGSRAALVRSEIACLPIENLVLVEDRNEDQEDPNINLEKVSLFPNPAQKQINITVNDLPTSEMRLSIRNIAGATVYNKKQSLTGDTFASTIDCSDWVAGVYFVTINAGEYSSTHRLIIMN